MRVNLTDQYTNILIGNGASGAEVDNNGAIAIGSFAQALGQNSIAIGSTNGSSNGFTEALGDCAIAIGAGVQADNINGLGEIKIGSPIKNAYYYEGGTGWKVGSDVRDKINISRIPCALQFINTIQPIRFRYNYRRSYSETNSLLNYDKELHNKGAKADTYFSYGVSAQEVAQALEEIYGSKDYGQIVFQQEESNFEAIEDSYTINLVNFIPFLIGAINEQQEQIKSLQDRIVELEARVNE
jgi:hypothetical protein